MCRNIRTLHNFAPPATGDEMRAASIQFVRKLSGSTKPSHANEEALDRAVDEVQAAATRNSLPRHHRSASQAPRMGRPRERTRAEAIRELTYATSKGYSATTH